MALLAIEHVWFSEHIATYLAGGLEGEERARFEAHAAECQTCAADLERARNVENELTKLFKDESPAAGFEDRIISRLRHENVRRRIWIHPLIVKVSATAATIALVGGVGYVANQQLAPPKVASNLRQIGQALLAYSNDAKDSFPSSPHISHGSANNHDEDGQNVLYGTGHVEYQTNPFSGVQRDMIYPRQVTQWADARKSNYDQNDSVIVPTEERERASAAPFKPNEFVLQSPVDKEKNAEGDTAKLKDQVVLGKALQPVDAPRQDQAQVAEQQPAVVTSPVVDQRKIIRSGEIEFEVDSFDSSFTTISKIVSEESGFIATTNSQKLDNGKVKGTIIVRLPPDRLDNLVLKLRALGDLKRQNLTAQDVSKQYSDLESELRGARAMEERLLDMIKNGKGEIKDLLAAEKELAVWRGKLEKIQGEINFYNNQISLSTLSIDLLERNISSAAAASEQENVNAGVETEDVEKSRAEAIKAIDEAKGRIIESELKKLDAGQLAAKIVAEVPPENAGQIIDRLRQLGTIARLEIERKQSTQNGETPAAGARIEQKPTRLIISMYNLSNVAPRETTTLNLACDDVESVYREILARVRETSGGRIVTSNLNRAQPDQIVGSINFEVKSADAGAVLNDIRNAGDVMRLEVMENPDTANVTAAKRGFALQLFSAAQVPPRQSNVLGIEARDVQGALQKITAGAAQLGGRIIDSNVSQEADGRTIARAVMDVPLAQAGALVDQIKSSGTVRAQRESKNAQVPEGKLSRARIELTLATPDTIIAADQGFWGSIRRGLSTSAAGLLWSLQILIVGLCFVVPWALVMWGTWRLYKRARAPEGRGHPA